MKPRCNATSGINPSMADSGRITELDALRGIASFAVVLSHAVQNVPAAGPLAMRIVCGTPLRVLVDGRQPVVFFFVLSGLVLTRALGAGRSPGYLGYAARRAIRLHDPTLWYGPDAWLARGWTRAPSAADIPRTLLLSGLDGDYHLDVVLWSLAHELRLSLLLPLLLLFAAGGGDAAARAARTQALPILAGALLFGLSLGVAGTSDDRALDGSSRAVLLSLGYRVLPAAIVLWAAVRASLLPALLRPARAASPIVAGLLVAGVAGGFLLGRQIDGGGQVMLGTTLGQTVLATLWFAPCFVLGAALALGALDRFAPRPGQRAYCFLGCALLLCFDNIFATAAASMLVILAVRAPGRAREALRGKALVLLGRISFSLYLVHVPLLLAMSHALHGVLSPGAIVALWLPLTLPAAWLFHRVAEQPAQRLARRAGMGDRGLAAPPRAGPGTVEEVS
jgi:peptidoglycan/LPS O-acetylase OafA/YrhL